MKSTTRTAIAAWAAAYAALITSLLWSAHSRLPLLIAAAIFWASSCLLLVRARLSRFVSLPLYMAVVLIGISLGVQTLATWRITRIASDWPQLVAARRANFNEMLERRVGQVVALGTNAAKLAAQEALTTDTTALFHELATLQASSKVDAIAVFGEAGQLIAWAGEHRAPLSPTVRLGSTKAVFIEQPLYSYIYFPARSADGSRHAVAAVVLGTAVHDNLTGESNGSIARFMDKNNAVFRPGKGPADAWPLVIGSDTVAHVRQIPLTQSEWRKQVINLTQRVTTLIAAAALMLLGIAWLRRPNRRMTTAVPLLAASLALAVAPLGAFGLGRLFSPALFLLPVPGSITLGTLLSVLLALAALAASLPATSRVPRTPTLLLIAGAVVVTIGYPGAIRLLIGPSAGAATDPVRAAGTQLLLGGVSLWFGLQIAAVLLLGIITELALPRWNWQSPLQSTAQIRSSWLILLIGALATSAALGLLVLLLGQTQRSVSLWFAAAFALPFLLAAFAIAAYRGSGIGLIRWVTAGWLAASAVLPFMWNAHIDARRNAADRELSTLGSNPDLYLDYLLRQFAQEATLRFENGDNGYLLLYRSWAASGFARESYSARLTIWSRTGVPEVQLPVGDFDEDAGTQRPPSVPPYLEAAFARALQIPDSTELMQVEGVPDANMVMIRALDPDRVLTVEVPPRRTLEHRSLPFLAARGEQDTNIELVPARSGVQPAREWIPTESGWRSEKIVTYADGAYHAHLDMHVPRMGVRVARGVLLLTADLALFTLLWLFGRAARGEHLAIRAGWLNWRGTFRGRVTATLFFFFLIPTTVFGWVAFRALAREVTRATRIVAERAARQAVVEFADSRGDLGLLAQHTGADILYYFQGELARASAPEAPELGVFGAWMPANVYLALAHGDQNSAVETRDIAGQNVLTAYRSLIPAGLLAVPMPLESGETAVRQQELAHLILFAAVVGGLLSLLLSVVVGRALTGPIGRLQRAAAQVGSGNLKVRLPENTGDEFGQLYASFNRMARRLRRARTQELRTARVLAWGEMAKQVAHEIKNPLTPIKLAVQHLKRAYADRKTDFGSILDSSVEQILLEIDRLSEIARAFSRYGAPAASTGPLENVNLHQVIAEALTLYRAGDPEVEYSDVIDPDVPRALGRSGELKEVLLNLLENARAALDGAGGRIEVTARRNLSGIELSVSDNGPGIPPDFLQRVFDPHFSTRSAGTGLGLAIVKRLVESWGGSVTADSELGAGTTIRVILREAD